jgi:rhodanese-related sulfurtransferase
MKTRHPKLTFVAFVLAFVLVIVIGLLTLNKPDLKYKLTVEESLEQFINNEDHVYPEDLVGMIEMEEAGFILIDIRNPFEYIEGHIDGAVNIPSNSLLDKENLKMFNELASDSVSIIIYGQTQLEANGPWMILKQMGYNNFKVLLGGYHYFTTGPLDFYDMPEIPEYLVEEAAYDFYGVMEAMGSITEEGPDDASQSISVVPVRKTKTSAVEGGC